MPGVIKGSELTAPIRVPGADLGQKAQNVLTGETSPPPQIFPAFTKTTDPTANDDVTIGALVHSQWINISTPSVWVCVNNTRGSADWVQTGGIAVMSAGTLWVYRAKTSTTSGYPGDGYLLWDNATQTSAAHLLFSHLTFDDLDIDVVLGTVASGNTIIIQDSNDSANFQNWSVTGSPTNTNPGTATSYWTMPVTLNSSGGTGATGFQNNHRLAVFVVR